MLCGLDFETTGVDPNTCLPIEVAIAIRAPNAKRCLHMQSDLIFDPIEWDTPVVSPENQAIHGISNEDLQRHGRLPENVFEEVHARLTGAGVKWVVAHNGNGFDKVIARRFYPPLAQDFVWVDSRTDVPYPDGWSRRLGHLALEHEFLNPFPHNALPDVLTMLKVVSHYNWDEIVERAKSPSLVVMACVSFEDKDKAKAQRYFWEKYDDEFFPKRWIKKIKECDLAREIQVCDFTVEVIKKVPPC